LYLPLTCPLKVKVTPADGKPFEVTARIQRVQMVDRKPIYYLGTAFEGLAKREQGAIDAVLAMAQGLRGQALTEKSRA
jgi:hypothetical protein